MSVARQDKPVERIQRSRAFRVAPETLLFDWRLSARAKELWLVLDSFAGGRDQAWPGIEGLHKRMVDRASRGGENLPSERTIKRAMRELVESGWVKRQRRRGTSSLTFLCSEPGELAPWEVDHHQEIPFGPDSAQPVGPDSAQPVGPDSAQPVGPDSARKRETNERDTEKDTAVKIARYVMENREHCSQSFVAVRSVVAALQRAGHDPKIIAEGLCEASTVSTRSFDVWFSQQRRRRPAAVERAKSGAGQKAGRIDD